MLFDVQLTVLCLGRIYRWRISLTLMSFSTKVSFYSLSLICFWITIDAETSLRSFEMCHLTFHRKMVLRSNFAYERIVCSMSRASLFFAKCRVIWKERTCFVDSLASLYYDDKRKLIFIICDGNIIGSRNDRTTPRIVLDILGVDSKFDPEPSLFKSIGEGSKALNYGKVFSGLYEFKGHVVPCVPFYEQSFCLFLWPLYIGI